MDAITFRLTLICRPEAWMNAQCFLPPYTSGGGALFDNNTLPLYFFPCTYPKDSLLSLKNLCIQHGSCRRWDGGGGPWVQGLRQNICSDLYASGRRVLNQKLAPLYKSMSALCENMEIAQKVCAIPHSSLRCIVNPIRLRYHTPH